MSELTMMVPNNFVREDCVQFLCEVVNCNIP
jgi:hypothetical protein